MKGFIEVNGDGDTMFLNVNHIIRVVEENEGNTTSIHLTPALQGGEGGVILRTEESYEEIKELIQQAL